MIFIYEKYWGVLIFRGTIFEVLRTFRIPEICAYDTFNMYGLIFIKNLFKLLFNQNNLDYEQKEKCNCF